MSSYLERYRQGGHQQVWSELVSLGDQVRVEPVFSDALAVAGEIMARVRKNLEMLTDRLSSMGYQFQNSGSVIEDPSPDVMAEIAGLEEKVGPLPLSLRAFYEVVGAVDLRGQHPDWKGCEYPDPLVVLSIEAPVSEVNDWEQSWEEYERTFGSFRAPIAPDCCTKEDVSGGMWYGIALPNPGVDAMLLEEWHGVMFVDYLRICFQWGGFPGLARARSAIAWPVEALKAGLVEI